MADISLYQASTLCVMEATLPMARAPIRAMSGTIFTAVTRRGPMLGQRVTELKAPSEADLDKQVHLELKIQAEYCRLAQCI